MRSSSSARPSAAALAVAAHAGPRAEFDAAVSAARPAAENAARVKAMAARPEVARLARVTGTDERYGVPAFVWAVRQPAPAVAAAARPARTPDQAARAYLGTLAPLYRLDRADVTGAKLAYVHDTGRGPVIATYRQEVDGIEVFDPLKDLTPISMVSINGMALVVHPDLPVHSVRELIDYVKARPGKVNYAGAGLGQSSHLAPAAFAARTGLDQRVTQELHRAVGVLV